MAINPQNKKNGITSNNLIKTSTTTCLFILVLLFSLYIKFNSYLAFTSESEFVYLLLDIRNYIIAIGCFSIFNIVLLIGIHKNNK